MRMEPAFVGFFSICIMAGCFICMKLERYLLPIAYVVALMKKRMMMMMLLM